MDWDERNDVKQLYRQSSFGALFPAALGAASLEYTAQGVISVCPRAATQLTHQHKPFCMGSLSRTANRASPPDGCQLMPVRRPDARRYLPTTNGFKLVEE